MARSAIFPWQRGLTAAMAAAALAALTACAPTVTGPRAPVQAPVEPAPPLVMEPTAPVTIEELGTGQEDGRTRVALLVPLTGAGSEIGRDMLNAAELALFDVSGDGFELLPRDTLGTPQGALDAAREAVAEGADLIIGPLFSSSVLAVKPFAQQARVPMLAFSNDWTLAGGNTWIMGLVPMEQVQRVVDYAVTQGMTRFGGLAPRTPYGDTVASALRDSVSDNNVQLVRLERYDPAADPATAARAIAAAGPDAYDSILLAEGGDRLRALAATLPLFEIDPRRVQLLGTGLWDEAEIGQEPVLVGGLYAAPDPAARADFERRYQDLYGEPPARLSTLAYDATALAAVLARGVGPQPYSTMNLTNPSGFAGVDGIFRLLPSGLVERGLAVLEVTRGGPRVVDPAPQTFQPFAY